MPNTLKLLVTDDEDGMRMGVARALRSFTVEYPDLGEVVDFEVGQASSGEETLRMLEGEVPDILLLDYKLPGMSGLDVLGEISDRGLDILTVMVTAYASLETAITATKRGAHDFLAKPFTPGELKISVRKAARHLILQRRAKQLAEERRKVRFEFIRVLAHELKSPLAAVENYLYMVKSRTLGEEIGGYDKVVGRSLLRIDGMRKLILDLLDLTRIESGTRDRAIETIDVGEAVDMAVEMFSPEAAKRDITISQDVAGGLQLQADRGELDIILNNLVSNAIKYNRDGGKVTVRAGRDDGHVVLTVADTGIGMTDEEAARLFNEFTRIKNEKTRDILGSGLGLSIVKKLAALYDGDVSVSSVPDGGSTFSVRLAAE